MKRALQGVFMLISSLLVLYVVQVWYVPAGLAFSSVFHLVEIQRWRGTRNELITCAFWPAMILSLYWIVRDEERDRRERIVEEVMES